MPGHAHHLRAIIAIVQRPPDDRGGEKILDIVFQLREINRIEGSVVIELFAQRIGLRPVRVGPLNRQPIGLPVRACRWRAERPADTVPNKGALAGRHLCHSITFLFKNLDLIVVAIHART